MRVENDLMSLTEISTQFVKTKTSLKLSGIDKDFLLMKLFKEVIFAIMYYSLNSKLFYPFDTFLLWLKRLSPGHFLISKCWYLISSLNR